MCHAYENRQLQGRYPILHVSKWALFEYVDQCRQYSRTAIYEHILPLKKKEPVYEQVTT